MSGADPGNIEPGGANSIKHETEPEGVPECEHYFFLFDIR